MHVVLGYFLFPYIPPYMDGNGAKRFHQVEIASSSVHRILDRHTEWAGCPAKQKHQQHRKRWKRYGAQGTIR